MYIPMKLHVEQIASHCHPALYFIIRYPNGQLEKKKKNIRVGLSDRRG
jgi:hypothetical protein